MKKRYVVRRVLDTWAAAWPRCHTWDVVDRVTGRTVDQGIATRRAAKERAADRERVVQVALEARQ
jgi:hypothetical protein